MAVCQDTLGHIYLAQERFEEAAASLSEAAESWQRHGRVRHVGKCEEILFTLRIALQWTRDNPGLDPP